MKLSDMPIELPDMVMELPNVRRDEAHLGKPLHRNEHAFIFLVEVRKIKYVMKVVCQTSIPSNLATYELADQVLV